MTRTAVNFECERMEDGSERVRFLDQEDTILGQQFIAPEGLVPLQLIVALAHAKFSELEPEAIQAAFRASVVDASLSTVRSLADAARVRAGLTPNGDVDLRAIEDE